MTRSRSILALAAALAVMLAWAAPAAAQGRGFFGVIPQGGASSVTTQDLGLMKKARVGSLRIRVAWRDLARSDGSFDFSSLDRVIGGAAARRIRSLPFISQKPPPRTQAQRRALADFASAIVRRYGPKGAYWRGPYGQAFGAGARPMPIVSWQIFNEQNGPVHWGARPSPKVYAQALKTTSRAIRRVHKRAEIVLGGMFATPNGQGKMTSWQYLRRLYRVKGVKRAFSTVAVHPYAGSLKGIRQQIQRIRKVMGRNGDRKARLRITEFGWGSARGGHRLLKGPKGQARMLRKSLRMLKKNRKRWKIAGTHWFSWQDGTVGCPFCPSSGLLTDDRQRKPAFRAFRAVAR